MNFGIKDLENTGIKWIGDEKILSYPTKTFVVVGVARGGTSLISGVLDNLGVFTGESSKKPVFEDVCLAKSFELKDQEKQKEIISKYNDMHNIWSFKRPSSIDYLKELKKLLRNPVFLFVFKDVFAIASRNEISMKTDVLKGMLKAHDSYGKVLDFISDSEVNGFLFSYEKIMSNKEYFIDILSDAVCLDGDVEAFKNNALNFVRPNPADYLDASRITKGQGQIGVVKKDKVVGWGKYLSSNDPAKVELYINDTLVDTAVANEFRQHLRENGIHPTGMCGYSFSLKNMLRRGDKVSVKLSDDVHFLKNSGKVFDG